MDQSCTDHFFHLLIQLDLSCACIFFIYISMHLLKLLLLPNRAEIDARVKLPCQRSCVFPVGSGGCRSRSPAVISCCLWAKPKTSSSRLIKIKRMWGHSARLEGTEKIKPSSYYSLMISNSRALSYAWATVESALLRSTAVQSPPMGFVSQRVPFVPMASELLMDEHEGRLPHVSLFHTYFNSNEDFCSLC